MGIKGVSHLVRKDVDVVPRAAGLVHVNKILFSMPTSVGALRPVGGPGLPSLRVRVENIARAEYQQAIYGFLWLHRSALVAVAVGGAD